MNDRGLHRIEDELGEHWLTCWIEEGIAEIEAYLAKHAAFLSFLDTADSTQLNPLRAPFRKIRRR